jgi:hypothetical protein
LGHYSSILLLVVVVVLVVVLVLVLAGERPPKRKKNWRNLRWDVVEKHHPPSFGRCGCSRGETEASSNHNTVSWKGWNE